MPNPICLYCSSPGLSREHILPAAFGEFEGAPILRNRICGACNQRLGILDEQMTRSGPDAFIRNYFSISGRSSHDRVNNFYRGSAGGQRLEMKIFDPSLGIEVLIERTNGAYRQMRQIIVTETATGTSRHIPIPDDMTAEQLRAAVDSLSLTPPVDIILISSPEEEPWVHELLRMVSPATTFGDSIPGTISYGPGAVVSFGLTQRYFRAVAKIGFHYFLSQFQEYTGHEPEFSGIRRYISVGDCDVTRANEFVGERQVPLLAQALGGARPDGWVGHILCADINNGEYRAHVQTFICDEFKPRIYTVRLGRRIDTHKDGAAGHRFVYFTDGHHGGFAGVTNELTSMRMSVPSPPLEPVVKNPLQTPAHNEP